MSIVWYENLNMHEIYMWMVYKKFRVLYFIEFRKLSLNLVSI